MNNPKPARLRAWLLPLCCALLCALTACSDDDPVGATYDVQTLKVAVLMEPAEQARWERTARWALDNIAQAQQGLAHRVQLQLEFYNQDADDIENTMRQIAADTTIAAVVGPTTSPRATLVAQKLNAKKAYHKPMITPSATGTEYQRTFANTPFVWNLAESNIAQLEVLIAGIASHANETTVALLTADEGNDFEEWFGFITVR
jgi:ABC-type branched-subunit amino acid transport system substrate-binding protein